MRTLGIGIAVGLSVIMLDARSVLATPDDGSCEETLERAPSLLGDLEAVLAAALPPTVHASAAAAPVPPEPPAIRGELPFRVPGLSYEKLATALRAYRRAGERGLVRNRRLTVIDYGLPSTQKRMWVLDPETGEVIFHELVAHGRGSGDHMATRFGNGEGSHRTSLGVFTTAETYRGKHGYSLRLDGRDPAVNDLARRRAIVIHSADYVTPAFAQRHGRLGRSHGCPAVDPRISRALIDEVKGSSVMVAFGGDDAWIARSPLARP